MPVVTAPLVGAKLADGRLLYLYRGDVTPDLPADELKRLTALGVFGDEDDLTEQAPKKPEGSLPAKAGKGSTAEAWHEYAIAKGVEVDPDAKRDEVIAALEAAGVPTE